MPPQHAGDIALLQQGRLFRPSLVSDNHMDIQNHQYVVISEDICQYPVQEQQPDAACYVPGPLETFMVS